MIEASKAPTFSPYLPDWEYIFDSERMFSVTGYTTFTRASKITAKSKNEYGAPPARKAGKGGLSPVGTDRRSRRLDMLVFLTMGF